MSCTSYGSEREDPDWTKEELELLEAELETARKRERLAVAKSYGWSMDNLEYYDKNYPTDRNVVAMRKRIAAAEQEVYEAAHDRHFFDSLKRRRALTHAHAHQPHRNTNG